jgi:hypothetical protein
MSNKNFYVVQPYKVGTRSGKSIAMIIPAGFAKENHIDVSTIFVIKRLEDKTGNIVFQRVNCENEKMISTGKSLGAPSQQISIGSQKVNSP